MHVTANRAINERDKGLTDEHMAQADAKEQAILIDASTTKGGQVQWVVNERIGKHRHALIQMMHGKFLDDDRHVYLPNDSRTFAPSAKIFLKKLQRGADKI